MKIFCHIPREEWFCDRYGLEYKNFSSHEVSFNSIDKDTDLIWLLAAWCWKQINPSVLMQKKVVCTIHHEVPWKFDENRRKNFLERDAFVDVYHVPCEKTKEFIKKHTSKPIEVITYWCNYHLFKEFNRNETKKFFNLPLDKFIVGSFQRDTEGSDLKTPKLEKGPDIFVEYVKKLISSGLKVHVLLNGWRRNYIIKELRKENIEFSYIERPPMEIVSKMYSALDLYVVGSRVEGGPQAIIECGMTNTPVVSTDVGIASTFLKDTCIFNYEDNYKIYIPNKSDLDYLKGNVEKYKIENQVAKYDNFFKGIVK